MSTEAVLILRAVPNKETTEDAGSLNPWKPTVVGGPGGTVTVAPRDRCPATRGYDLSQERRRVV